MLVTVNPPRYNQSEHTNNTARGHTAARYRVVREACHSPGHDVHSAHLIKLRFCHAVTPVAPPAVETCTVFSGGLVTRCHLQAC